ncbi:MAG: rhomboid family intramembrane serine protease [Pseudomonadota bacterium]
MIGQEKPISSENSQEELLIQVTEPEHLNTYSLVLSSANITHRIRIVSLSHLEIYVTSTQREKAWREIKAYTDENKDWPPQPQEYPISPPTFQAMSPFIIGCLVLIHGLTGDWLPESLWFVRGAGNSEAILHNSEYFRLVTALTLHADSVHLLSNCIFGFFLLHFFLQYTGNGIGLFAIVFTSVIANYLNVLAHGPGHMFVGFSTAIFSVIGMLCTMSFAFKTPRIVLHIFMPLMAGLALLAFLGSEGERTDLGSHLFGLFVGLICGNFVRLPFFSSLRASFWLQTWFGAFSLLVFYGCWLLAFSL